MEMQRGVKTKYIGKKPAYPTRCTQKRLVGGSPESGKRVACFNLNKKWDEVVKVYTPPNVRVAP